MKQLQANLVNFNPAVSPVSSIHQNARLTTKTRTNHPDPGGHGPNHQRKNHVFGVEANNTTEPIAPAADS